MSKDKYPVDRSPTDGNPHKERREEAPGKTPMKK